MKVLTVTRLSGSGKTTVIENLIKELKRRGYSIGSVKEIHLRHLPLILLERTPTDTDKQEQKL